MMDTPYIGLIGGGIVFLLALLVILRHITFQNRAESLRFTQFVVDHMADAAFWVNGEGQFVYVNKASCEGLGYTKEELLTLRVGDINASLIGDEWQKHWGELQQKKSLTFEGYHKRKSGDLFPVEIQANYVSFNEKAYACGIVRDITLRKAIEVRRKRAEEELRRFAVEMESRNQELDAFAHTVAHDLKSPIGVILGFSELLLDDEVGDFSADVNHALKVIAQSGRKLNTIIEELMLLSGVRKKTIVPTVLDMSAIIEEAKSRFFDQIEQRKAKIVLRDVEKWPRAMGYGPWVEEVWANYLSNAIKYGGAPPFVEVGADYQSEGMVRFWVRDNGSGLTSEAQAQLFTPFTRLNQVKVEGQGLGLSIVQRIMDKLGGKAGVESELGQGSTFFFTLPSMESVIPVGLEISSASFDDVEDEEPRILVRFRALPESWRRELEVALIARDVETIKVNIQRIKDVDPLVGDLFSMWSAASDYEGILGFMRDAA